jgi:hypothetical protein
MTNEILDQSYENDCNYSIPLTCLHQSIANTIEAIGPNVSDIHSPHQARS